MSSRDTERNTEEDEESAAGEGRWSGLLRSLMGGIPWSESADGQELIHIPAPRKKSVHIHNANGRIEIVGEERSDIELLASKQARAECSNAAQELINSSTVKTEIVDGVLEIDVIIPRKWNRHGRVNLTARLPQSLDLEVTSSNGRVCVEGMRASVHAHASNGSICIEDVVGDVKVTAANAKVRCSNTCGRLLARSSNGKLELSDHTGPVDACTSNGSIRASVGSVEGDGVMLATSNGRIVLELPDGVNAEMDVRVDNGVIRNDLPLRSSGAESAGRLRGRLGRGGPLIRLRTSNGSVTVR